MDRETELEVLIRSKYPLIYVLSWEERRVEAMLRRIASRRGKHLLCWTVTEGIRALDTARAGHPASTAEEIDYRRDAPSPQSDPSTPGSTGLDHSGLERRDTGPLQALEAIAGYPDAAIFLLKDLHLFLQDTRLPDTIRLIRKVRDLVQPLKESEKTVVLLSPVLRYPPELEKAITLLDYSLPTQAELAAALQRVVRSARSRREGGTLELDLDRATHERVLKAAQGLTVGEAENVFAKSLVTTHRLDLDAIVAEKRQIIQKSRVLEYCADVEDMAHVGGMAALKGWLGKRGLAFSERARRFGLPEPRGLLLLGVQGGGKSLVAKSVASLWKLPLLRLDMGKVYSERVGASEENIRLALRLAESVSPCVLWLDELEKGLSGLGSSNDSDAGTAARVFSSFLVWMQEKRAPVFVMATCNDIGSLPPELLRKGRFDEIFFIDLPTFEERKEILAIHLARRHRDPARFGLDLLSRAAAGFSGAEIEQAIISALYDAFEAGREMTGADLLANIQATVPLSQTCHDQVAALREWARTHARSASPATPAALLATPLVNEIPVDQAP